MISEAYGPSYQDFARVSMNTGLPTVLGWDYHVHQRAHDWPDINRRKADLKHLYTSDKEPVVKEILQKYHVALVYVGRLERREYAGGNLERFNDLERSAGAGLPERRRHHLCRERPVHRRDADHHHRGGAAGRGGRRRPRPDAAGRSCASRAASRIDAAGQRLRRRLRQRPHPEVRPATWTSPSAWGERGNLPGQFKQPGDVAVGPHGNVYVADTWNQRVQVFTPDGKYVREWGGALLRTARHRRRRRRNGLPGRHRQPQDPALRRRGARTSSAGAGWARRPVSSRSRRASPPTPRATSTSATTATAGCRSSTATDRLLGQFAVPGWESKVFSEPHVVIAPDGAIWVTVPLLRAVRAYDRERQPVEGAGRLGGSGRSLPAPDGHRLDEGNARAHRHRPREPPGARAASEDRALNSRAIIHSCRPGQRSVHCALP